jgi:hypothetical protein
MTVYAGADVQTTIYCSRLRYNHSHSPSLRNERCASRSMPSLRSHAAASSHTGIALLAWIA